MVTRTWIGGGNNNASNPKDWSPTGVPQAGDTLIFPEVPGGPPPGPTTINVTGNELAGDTFDIKVAGEFTANLSHKATMTATMAETSAGTFNVSGQSTLVLTGDAPSTVNLSGGSTLDFLDGHGGGTAVNVSGSDNLTADIGGLAGLTVNLGKNANLTGSFSLSGGEDDMRINGGTFNNNGDSVVGMGGNVILNTSVVGNGTITVDGWSRGSGARLEFVGSAGSKLSVIDHGLVVIDQPKSFSASLTLAATQGQLPSEIDLNGLLNADSYTFKKDMLSVFAGGKVIDSLHLTDATQFGFEIEKTTTGLSVLAYSDATHAKVGITLPMHV